MLLIGQKKFFAISKTKNTVPSTFVIMDLNDAEIVGTWRYEKELRKIDQSEFRTKGITKRKGNKLYNK